MDNMIKKVLFVGLGGVGQRHLRNLRILKGDAVEIYAYRVRKSSFVLNDQLKIVENEELDIKYGLHCVSSMEEAFKNEVDTVFICNPTSMHLEILEQCIKHDCNIFIEKPISHNLSNFENINEYLERYQKVLFVGYQNRYHPCIQKMKEVIEKKTIGRVVSVNAEIGECVKNWHKYEDYRKMYACRSDLGGGVVVTQIHELDYLYYIFGMPEKVYAVGGKLSDLEIDVEDVADILMTYKIDSYHIPVMIHEDYLQNPARRMCRVIGTEGKVEVDLLKASIDLYDAGGNLIYHELYDFNRNDMFVREMQDFIRSIEEDKAVSISFEEGMKSLEIAMKVKESLERGIAVDI